MENKKTEIEKVQEKLDCHFCGSKFTVARQNGTRWCRKCGEELKSLSEIKKEFSEENKIWSKLKWK